MTDRRSPGVCIPHPRPQAPLPGMVPRGPRGVSTQGGTG